MLRSRAVVAVPFTASAYPERLRTLPDAAPLLLVRGDPAVLRRRAVAIVGARAATAYGLEVARRLAGPLAAAGIVIISGLARGIDSAAHREALVAGGLTIAFQACGPDRTYPAGHRDLADEVCASGAVVTEMPPGTPPRPAYFPLRNRLISGLAEIVIVVEARARSGSLVTARCALDQGRDVMAVPGPITAPTSEGPNRLLADGARPVLGPDDVFRELGIEPPAATNPTKGAAPVAASRREGSRERAILRSLAREPATKDALAHRLEVSPEVLALDLIELELAGRVGLDRDGRLRMLRSS